MWRSGGNKLYPVRKRILLVATFVCPFMILTVVTDTPIHVARAVYKVFKIYIYSAFTNLIILTPCSLSINRT